MNVLDRMITDVDRRRLGTFIDSPEGRAWGSLRAVDTLEVLLEDANPVPAADAPDTLVTMNTTVKLEDVDSGERRVLTLAYPMEVDFVPHGVSVVEPVGLALIGRQVGAVLQYPQEPGATHERIAQVVYQPEHAGALHL